MKSRKVIGHVPIVVALTFLLMLLHVGITNTSVGRRLTFSTKAIPDDCEDECRIEWKIGNPEDYKP